MGFLSIFSKSAPSLLRLPAGSLTIGRDGEVLARTIPSSFPQELIQVIAEEVLAGFREAATAHLPVSELLINYPSLTIKAREMRGGAMIFLTPKTPYSPSRRR